MRKIVVMLSVSVDGFVEGPDKEIDWHLVDDELHDHFNQQLAAMSAFLSGRVTYELMARFWPTADQDPTSTRPMIEFAHIWRNMPKIVFSKTLQRSSWNTTIVRDVVPEEIQSLKARPGGDMALGGADLAEAFREKDLVDEYRLYIHPVVLGRGKPLFRPAEERTPLRLVDTRRFGNGVVLLHYVRPTSDGRKSLRPPEVIPQLP